MAPLKLMIVAAAAGLTSAFAPSTFATRQQQTHLYENFGLDYAEDTYDNQPDLLKGEQEYKQYMNRVNPDNMLNRKYNVIQRVRELDLLQKTVDNGVLSKLEKNGLDLATVEKLLPLLEEYGLLSVAANNQQLLVNLVAPLAIEGAPFLLPPLAGALEVGPSAFFLGAAALGGLDLLLLLNNVEIPFLGLSAGFYLGLLLIPLAAVSATAGVALGSLKK